MTDETKDTQPMLQTILDRMNAGFEDMRNEFAAIKAELAKLNRKFDLLAKRVIEVEASSSLLEDRVTSIENRKP
jgi:predicted nuclease with TOPRIM domain